MIGYASRTGTSKNVAALKAAGWGWMVGPLDHGAGKLFGMRYALDNGAWPAFLNKQPWNEAAFLKAIDRFGGSADFVVVPDVVAGGAISLQLSIDWLDRLKQMEAVSHTRLLIAVQDGIGVADIRPLLDNRVGIFCGGSTEWKLENILPLGALAREVGCYFHVGRVNTAKRIYLCQAAGADSFDGTSATKFVSTLPLLERARGQDDLFRDIGCQ